jgi:PAS domain S-box-containing protein
MLAINQPYTILLTFAALISASLVVIILKQRPNLGTRSFSVLMAAVSLWAFVSIFEVCSQDTNTKVFSYLIKFVFIVFVPGSWLTFSLYYSNRLRKFEYSYLLVLSIIPSITLLMVATNQFHQMIFTRFEIVDVNSYRLLYPYFGPVFWVHVFYSYCLLITGFVFLAKHLIDTPTHYQRQVTYLLVGGLVPWISNITFIFKIVPLSYFDFTPVAFSITGVLFLLGILRYKLLDIVPIARDVVIQNMKDGVIVVDDNGNIIDLNHTARRLSGIKEYHAIGATAEQIIPWWSNLKQHRASGKKDQPILELDDGNQIRFLQLNQSALFNRDKPLGFMLTLHDVTATKLAEQAMRESEERFKSLSENAPVIIFALDEKGTLDYVNPAWQKQLGHSRQEVIGHPWDNFISQDQKQTVGQTFERLIKGRLQTAELNLYIAHKDGTKRLFNTSAATNSDAEGRVTGIIGMAKDVTEEKRLERQLVQSQKMEAIGTLAGGIAHDFNNLLMGIQANLSLMQIDMPQSQSFDEKFRRIEDQIRSGAALTRQLLGYAREGKYAVTVFDLNELVKETLNVVRRTNKNIVVQPLLCEKEACIRADQGQIELVLLNLFINAVDAMPNGGELTVTTVLATPRGRGVTLKPPPNGHFVEVTIKDTGTGMDKKTLDRIFEPFFTTKEIGRGTGLGLASVYGIVQNHFGNINVQSEPDQGTTFTLILPSVAAPENQCTTEANVQPMNTENKKVLLVDDEPQILQYTCEMIASLGVSVISTQHSDEAIDLYQDQWKEIDIVVLDIVMPKMDGMELLKAMEKINPKIRAIVTTGYALESRISKLLASGQHQFLKKPYTRDDMAKAIAELACTPSKRTNAVKASAVQ